MDHSKTVVSRSTLDFKFNQFVKGAITPLRALEYIFEKKGLFRLSLAPLLVAMLVFVLIIIGIFAGAWAAVHSAYLSILGDFTGIAFAIVSALLIAALALAGFSLFTFIITLCASPFNDMLAERTEREMGIQEVPHWSVGRFFRVMWIDLRKTIITIFSALVFGAGMMVPVANIIFLLGLALLNTFTFITYPQSRREQGIIASLRWIRDNLYLSLGFGFITLALFSIPIVDFFALPISVVGGTLLYCESLKHSRN